MKKLAIVLAIMMMAATLACAAEAPKDKPKAEQTAVQKPEEPKAKAPSKELSLQELQAQRTAIALRVDGATAAKQAIERIILDGQVTISKLDEMIQSKTPKQEPKK